MFSTKLSSQYLYGRKYKLCSTFDNLLKLKGDQYAQPNASLLYSHVSAHQKRVILISQ